LKGIYTFFDEEKSRNGMTPKKNSVFQVYQPPIATFYKPQLIPEKLGGAGHRMS
jgi:hypothetical protein